MIDAVVLVNKYQSSFDNIYHQTICFLKDIMNNGIVTHIYLSLLKYI